MVPSANSLKRIADLAAIPALTYNRPVMTPFLAPLVIPYPDIHPVLVQIGPFAIRWYALAYIAGLVIGWRFIITLARRPGSGVKPEQADDFLLWATIGVVLGGRLGYVLFYKPGFYFENPLQVLYVWHGGMSFHGGLLGVLIAMALFTRRYGIRLLDLADLIARVAPIGLFFGRLANFINGELWGRPTDVPWAMVFPTGGPAPRHPSQLYEAGMEGVLLFLLLWWASGTALGRQRGGVAGLFLIGYGTARIVGEFFREPDAFLGFLIGGATMGQLLSLPMIALGLYLLLRREPRGEPRVARG